MKNENMAVKPAVEKGIAAAKQFTPGLPHTIEPDRCIFFPVTTCLYNRLSGS